MSVKTHELKTWPVVFQAIVDGSKTFEFRKNDRDFKSGDEVTLAEWNPTEKEYTGRTQTFTVGHVAKGAWGIPDGYCVFSLIPPTLRTRLQQVESERDAAIKEANRRDQKWMDGINEAVGRKLDYGDPCSRDNASKALSEIIIERDEAKVARDFAELACQRKEADAAVMRGLLSDSKRVLSRVLDWCLMDSPNFEIDGDAIGEAVHNINVFEGKSTLNPKPQDVK